MTPTDPPSRPVAQPVYCRAITVAAILSAFMLTSCGSSATSPGASATSSGASGTAEFCGTYRPASTKINAARDQINANLNSQTLQAGFTTIATQVKTALDAAPPAAVKGDIQTFYDAVVQTQGQLAAVSYDPTKLQKPLALQDPKNLQAGNAIAKWAHTNCGTPLPTG